MTLQAEKDIVFIHTLAIVDDPDKAGAAAFDFNLDTVRSGIKAVFQQLLHHGGWTFDNLACCYPVGKVFGKDADFRHGKIRDVERKIWLNGTVPCCRPRCCAHRRFK